MHALVESRPIESEACQIADALAPSRIDPRDDGAFPRCIHDESGFESECSAAVADEIVATEPENAPTQPLL